MPTYHLDFGAVPVFEVGAAVLTATAVSEAKDTDDLRGAAVGALSHCAVLARSVRDPVWASSIVGLRPDCLSADPGQSQKIGGFVHARLMRRLIAAGIVLPFFEAAAGAPIAVHPETGASLSINSRIEQALEGTDGDACNIRNRSWRPSFPALHLIGAIVVEHVIRYGHYPVWLNYFSLFWDESFIRKVIARAMEFEPLMEKVSAARRLKFNPDEMVRLRVLH